MMTRWQRILADTKARDAELAEMDAPSVSHADMGRAEPKRPPGVRPDVHTKFVAIFQKVYSLPMSALHCEPRSVVSADRGVVKMVTGKWSEE